VRDEAVKALVEYIETQPEIADLEWKKLWKGLFFCFWMSDKTLIQQDLADKLAQVVLQFEKEKALSYLAAFWAIMIREWYRIDRLRLDKYYMLLRKMHQIAILLLAKFEWEEEIVKRVMGIYCAGPLEYF
jgi:ribosomal RNA-processing protein 1